MCGICGFVGVGDLSDLSKMMAVMPYRGPDGEGQWHNGRDIYLGHLRLAIVDPEGGQQPLRSTDESIIVVFNGEIYNHHILRKELESLGHKFHTDHSDTEVIVNGYRQWGTDLTNRLNGMWAFALLDLNCGQLWLSRDRFGKKPLFYFNKGDNFVFSSELASLSTHQLIEPSIDRLSLKKYFAYGYVPAPRSLLTGVKKLPAGHDLIYDLRARRPTVRRYWRLLLEPDEALASRPAELSEQLISKLSNAVQIRLEADVPIGLFLSGGIDSSAVTALASASHNQEAIRTFSIGFEESSFDESNYARKIAQFFNTEHHSEVLSAGRCLDLLDSIYARLDEPLGDSSLVPSFLMCRLAKNEVTVALGGDGSDELFAGYDPFRALRIAGFYERNVPGFIHRIISHLVRQIPVSHRNMSLDFKMKKFLVGVEYNDFLRNPIWLGPLAPDNLAELFGEPINVEEIYSETIDAWNAPGSDNEIDRTLQFYSELYLQNDILAKMDRAGMLNSLEVRSPFLDYEFVDFVRRIPARFKYDSNQTKRILKTSLEPILPAEIVHRRKKGFGIPIGSWFSERRLEVDPIKFRGMLSNVFVEKVNQEHINNKADWRSFLWAYHSLERWSEHPSFRHVTV